MGMCDPAPPPENPPPQFRPAWRRPGRRGEVLDGRLVLSPPPSRDHERVVHHLTGQLGRVVGERAVVRTGQPVHLPDGDAPVPDVVVASTPPPLPLWPAAVHTVVEVTGTDGRFLDRVWKPRRYRVAGIPCFWRVELTPWIGHRGRLPVVVVRVREPAGWREMVVAPGQVRAVPVAYGRTRGGAALSVPVRLDPAILLGPVGPAPTGALQRDADHTR